MVSYCIQFSWDKSSLTYKCNISRSLWAVHSHFFLRGDREIVREELKRVCSASLEPGPPAGRRRSTTSPTTSHATSPLWSSFCRSSKISHLERRLERVFKGFLRFSKKGKIQKEFSKVLVIKIIQTRLQQAWYLTKNNTVVNSIIPVIPKVSYTFFVVKYWLFNHFRPWGAFYLFIAELFAT